MEAAEVVVKRKVVLLGDGGVGKTSLIRNFVLDLFDDKYIMTIGTKVSKKEVKLKFYNSEIKIVLMIWDILGQKGYQFVQWESFKFSYGAFMVCDITKKETLDSLTTYWVPELRKIVPDIPLIFLANKCDLTADAQFGESELRAITEKYNSPYYMTSAKTGMGVKEAFYKLAEIAFLSTSGDDVGTLAAPSKPVLTVRDVADKIIADFCAVGGYESIELAMPIIREQFERAKVDISNPTKEGLRKVIGYLMETEMLMFDKNTARKNAIARLRMVYGAKEA